MLREFHNASFINGEWTLRNGLRLLRGYDENGLTAVQNVQVFMPETGKYETQMKQEFL
jgi:hypothetical protein